MQERASRQFQQHVEAIGFSSEVKNLLNFFKDRTGLDLWMLTRVEGDDWIVLETSSNAYDIVAGDVFQWPDSFCCRMVKGDGPQISPDSNLIPAYVEAEIRNQVKINAYVGIPIKRPDGALFGTLCAIDPAPKS